MDERLGKLAARAASRHNVLTDADFRAVGVTRQLRSRWLHAGVIARLGPRSFGVAGSPPRWEQMLAAGLVDLGDAGYVAGRAGAALHHLDGFRTGALDFLIPRSARDRTTAGTVVSTRRPIPPTDVCRVDGIRCVRPERLILDAPLFGFAREEVENAIDSALRMGLIAEGRLRARVEREMSGAINGGRMVIDALVDMGGHSKLERAFLRILREAGVPRPDLQVTHRDGTRIYARVDTIFSGELVIEVEGHRTHSTRRQRQSDEQRRTELVLRGKRVIAFTYDDVMGRPDWTIARVIEARAGIVASA